MKIVRHLVLGTALVLPLIATATNTATPVPIDCGKAPGFPVEATIVTRSVTEIYITYIGTRPNKKQAEKSLRSCLDIAVQRDSTKDIIPSVWFRKNPKASAYGDDQIYPFGSRTYLYYAAETRKIEVKKMKGNSR